MVTLKNTGHFSAVENPLELARVIMRQNDRRDQRQECATMFKRFWESLNDWAEVLSMDDPRGEYMFRLEERVAKLEREVEGFQIQSRTRSAGAADDGGLAVAVGSSPVEEPPLASLAHRPVAGLTGLAKTSKVI
jgi:hypothetical protein